MTDYQRLVDFFMDEIPEDSPFEGKIRYLVEKLIAEGVTFQKWIPVTERLPEVGTGTVLVARIYNGKPYVDVGEFINGTACCWGDEYAINPREHIATHWMPLPAHPQEES